MRSRRDSLRSTSRDDPEIQREIHELNTTRNPFDRRSNILRTPPPKFDLPEIADTESDDSEVENILLPDKQVQQQQILDKMNLDGDQQQVLGDGQGNQNQLPIVPGLQPQNVQAAQRNLNQANGDRIPQAMQPNIIVNDFQGQRVSLRDAISIVPEFSGGTNPLTPFLEGCDEALSMIDIRNQANLVKLIRCKLQGEARRAIIGTNFNTVQELKNFLTKIYFASKTVYQLQGELGSMFQKEDESVISYANRIRDTGVKILETFKYENNPDEDTINEFNESNNTNMIHCFKRGLRPDIEQRLEIGATLAVTTNNAIRIERQLAAQNALRQGSSSRPDYRDREKKRIFTLKSNDTIGLNNLNFQNTYSLLYCQICESTDHNARMCPILQADFGNIAAINKVNGICQLCNSSEHPASKCPMIRCHKCAKFGHIARNCPELRENNLNACQLCLVTGHTAKHCPDALQNKLVMAQQVEMQPTCQLCNKSGHTAKTCFSNPQYKSSASSQQSCQICNKTGHIAKTCFMLFPPNTNEEKLKARAQMSCELCQQIGHTAALCKQRNCTYCRSVGHTINECFKRQKDIQGNGQIPSALSGQKEKSAAIRSIQMTETEDLSESMPSTY